MSNSDSDVKKLKTKEKIVKIERTETLPKYEDSSSSRNSFDIPLPTEAEKLRKIALEKQRVRMFKKRLLISSKKSKLLSREVKLMYTLVIIPLKGAKVLTLL